MIHSRPSALPRATLALILREMSTRYGRHAGGYLWAVAEPLGAILILAIGFSLILPAPPLGVSFLLFYASGFVPFALFQSVQVTVARALIFSRPLLNYPALRWIDAVIARFVLNALTGFLVAGLVLGVVLAIGPVQVVPNFGAILLALGLAAILGLGMGVLNTALMGLFPVWEHIWSILTRPLFLASGILFLPSDLQPALRDLLWFNPLIHQVDLMRAGLYAFYAPEVSILFVLGCALVPLALGLALLQLYHDVILSR